MALFSHNLVLFLQNLVPYFDSVNDLSKTSGIQTHPFQTEPRIPAVAVASGSHIYIYKNMRPYFKFTLPTLEIHSTEKELWTAAGSNDQPLGKPT